MAVRLVASRKTLAQTLTPALRHCRGLTTVTLPDLPYDYGALEPAISGEIMRLHHQKHHQTYVTNYNKALEQLESAVSKGDAPAVVQLQSALKFNGGGSIFKKLFRFFSFLRILEDEFLCSWSQTLVSIIVTNELFGFSSAKLKIRDSGIILV